MRSNRGIILVLCMLLIADIGYLLYPLVQHTSIDNAMQQFNITTSVPMWIALAIFGLMWLMLEIDVRRQKQTNAHGSAHYATHKEAKSFLHHTFLRRRKTNKSSKSSLLVLGKYKQQIISLTEKQQESNILLTASIGAGKSSRVIIPNLLLEKGSRSLFVSDAKGELSRLTSGAVARYHEVWIFAPMSPRESASYNPLRFIQTVEDAQELAACWVSNTGKSEEQFWANVAKKLMVAVMLHLKEAEPDAAFSRVADMLCSLTYEELKSALLTSPSRAAKNEIRTFFDYLALNPKLIGSVMTDISSRFQLLVSDQVKAVTTRNDIDFAAMTAHPIALYLSIPRRYAERYQPLLACFMMQMFSVWEQIASTTGQLPRGIMCYLDEFANLGYIPNISGYISTARSSRIALLIVLQSFNQLDEKYGQEVRKNILSQTTTHLLLSGAGIEETEYYSQRIGNSTIQKATESFSGESLLNNTVSRTKDETGRRLLMSDEIRTMSTDRMLMIPSTSAPILLQTTPYFLDRSLKDLTQIPPPKQKGSLLMPQEHSARRQEKMKEEIEGKEQQFFLDE